MLLKPPEELSVCDLHLFGFGSISVILVAEFDVGVIDFKNPVSDDGELVGTRPPCRYLPRYSTTLSGEPKGALA